MCDEDVVTLVVPCDHCFSFDRMANVLTNKKKSYRVKRVERDRIEKK